ncbi:Rv3654c family TadE-like protein [Clavibacter zhangzhiyongii]|jgi:secretion/DNA translocation related TadE-like protein|uniref:Rv3654c family TadE-like protein n=1 Tax=Clavibacter TaxID=1573 RepID=UPI0039DF58CB
MRREEDDGSGTVVAIGVLGAVTSLALAAVVASSALVERAAAAGAADSAALAAADAAAGFAAGSPCAAADEIAVAAGATLTECDVTGTTAAVRVTRHGGVLDLPVTARARAGQPPDPPPG